MIKRGPVDVVVMASGAPRFDGSVFAELKRQTAAGTIRVLDAMILLKDEAGDAWDLISKTCPQNSRKLSVSSRLVRTVCSTPRMPAR